MKCPECREIYDEDFEFCPYCGAKRPPPKICPNCGLEPSTEFCFCPKCGTELKDKREYINSQIIQAHNNLERAEELIESEDYELALTYLNIANPIYGENDEGILKAKMECLKGLERYEELMVCLEKLIKKNPLDASYKDERIKCLVNLERHDEALNEMDQLQNTKDEEILLMKKECQKEDETIETLDDLIETRPDNSSYRNEKIELLIKQEEDEEALNEISQAEKTEDILLKKKECPEKIEEVEMEKARQREKEEQERLERKQTAIYMAELGKNRGKEHRWREALEFYEKATNLDEENPQYWQEKAQCLKMLGKYKKSEECMEIYKGLMTNY